MLLTRSEIVRPAERRFAEYQLSDGRSFRVRSLNESERSQWEADSVDAAGKPKRDRLLSARRRLICLTLVDEQGQPLLSYGDQALLANQDGRTMEEVYRAAAKHCGIAENEVEALVKNSQETHAAASP